MACYNKIVIRKQLKVTKNKKQKLSKKEYKLFPNYIQYNIKVKGDGLYEKRGN